MNFAQHALFRLEAGSQAPTPYNSSRPAPRRPDFLFTRLPHNLIGDPSSLSECAREHAYYCGSKVRASTQ